MQTRIGILQLISYQLWTYIFSQVMIIIQRTQAFIESCFVWACYNWMSNCRLSMLKRIGMLQLINYHLKTHIYSKKLKSIQWIQAFIESSLVWACFNLISYCSLLMQKRIGMLHLINYHLKNHISSMIFESIQCIQAFIK